MNKNKTMFINLNNDQKIEIINVFSNSYCNTDQDTKLFGEEYYFLVTQILNNRLPIGDLPHLSDYKELLIKKLPYLKEYY